MAAIKLLSNDIDKLKYIIIKIKLDASNAITMDKPAV